MRAKRILMPTDFSACSKTALSEADSLAHERDGRLTLLYVQEIATVSVLDFVPVDAPDRTRDLCASAKERLGKWAQELQTPAERIDIVVEVGSPVNEIIKHAEDHDLVVMGTHSRKGIPHLILGSVAERVVQGSPCSVLIIKGTGPGCAPPS